MVTLTVTRAVLAQHGLRPGEMQETELSPEAARARRPLLMSHGFDLTAPIHVHVQRLGAAGVGRILSSRRHSSAFPTASMRPGIE
jgi:hypothetical protein